MKILLWTFLITLFSQAYASKLMHRSLLEHEQKNKTFIWEETQLSPFNELIVSWDAERPSTGSYLIQTSLLTSKWSPWIDYAFWGTYDQHTFKKDLPNLGIQVTQDAVEVLRNKKANGFRVRVIAKGTHL